MINPYCRVAIGEDPDDSSPATDLLVESFQSVDGSDPALSRAGKRVGGESFLQVVLQPGHKVRVIFEGLDRVR